MPSSSGTSESKPGVKSGTGKSASSSKGSSGSKTSSTQGGTHEQHVKAGEQSHKNAKS
ncbi:hypothetical protein HA459_27045 (plasmid) [Rhizobium leguminosarum bv. trifolii]|uniref:Uncharacterized protein n=1 Tax=Rhizobium leguminosarum bv. viciae TaxID=387 RepID=A0A7G6RNX2_RHILV|nr:MULTISPECIES: hypothetical protein [Rhizobium]QIO75671.1 hypothetical protein HA459_27045 [Rhizobium leguminosarum bv. trifolii]QIO82683.1 hypothetical protein HA460_27080 [Rhizobium leguminosarum bv. trifolii]QND43954.1 hypothetical protein HB770_33810 [Rhizobium leguminosarum bv. viciae]